MEKSLGVRRERRDMVRNLERVLEAANELFAARGNGVTMEEVARRAGVGVGTVYRRFPSKEHLFAAVSHAVCSDARHCMHQATQTAPDAEAKLRVLVMTIALRIERQSALLDPIQGGSVSFVTAAEQRNLYSELFQMFTQIIAEGQQHGMFAPGDLTAQATLCTEMLNPRVVHNLVQLTGGDATSAAEQITRFMLAGLGKHGAHE